MDRISLQSLWQKYRWGLLGLLGSVITLWLGLHFGQAVASFWYTPQNAPLPTLAPEDLATSFPQQTSAPTTAAEPSPAAPTASPTPTPEPLCGGPSSMDILLIGSYRGYYDLADAIRIAHVDFVRAQVMVITIPRDLKVSLPEDAPYPSPIKLNQSYFLGTPVMSAHVPKTGGAQLLARTLALNFGVQVNHYAIISGQGVEEIVDNVLKGVPICLSERIKDEATKLNLKPGCRVVDGRTFLKLLRYRGKNGDLFRLKHQSALLQGVLERIFSPSMVPQWDDLIRAYQDVVWTDLSPSELSQLACLGRHLSRQDIHFISPPEDLLQLSEEQIYLATQPIYSSVLVWDERFVQWLQACVGPSASLEACQAADGGTP